MIVHAAGHMALRPSEAFTPEQLAQQYDVDVLGAHWLNRAALPHMRERRDGLLVRVGLGDLLTLRPTETEARS